jgi:hypothetical protein
MTSKCFVRAACLALAGALAVGPAPRGAAQTALEKIAAGRDMIKAERLAVVAEALQLTEEEGRAFWPLYGEYWAALDGINDGLVKLVLEYADLYPNVPEDRAGPMLKTYVALEKKRLATRAAYLRKVSRTLSAAKALRWAQVENRLDVAVRLRLAGAIPLMPAPAK